MLHVESRILDRTPAMFFGHNFEAYKTLICFGYDVNFVILTFFLLGISEAKELRMLDRFLLHSTPTCVYDPSTIQFLA